jgi:predicted NUDIX family NTP pyrophosphohydrolase
MVAGSKEMAKHSAGLLMFRRRGDALEVFLVHPGGPFWAKKDLGAWSIPKGEYSADEDPLAAARREFEEETGIAPEGRLIRLSDIKQPSGKVIEAWAFEGDCDASCVRSNLFPMEWPPRSGTIREFPEIDRGSWFPIEEGRARIVKGQRGFLNELASRIGHGGGGPGDGDHG